jgi:hypothetical protein
MINRKSRWLRLSLRALFVLLLLVAILLGWNVHLVRQRKEMLSSLQSQGVVSLYAGKHAWKLFQTPVRRSVVRTYIPRALYQFDRRPNSSSFQSLFRECLGDEFRHVLYYSGPDPDSVQRRFPEALIMIPRDAD